MSKKIRKASAVISAAVILSAAFPSEVVAGVLPFGGETDKKGAVVSAQAGCCSIPEFRMVRGGDGVRPEPVIGAFSVMKNAAAEAGDLPKSFDMRESFGVPSVKDQGSYGTCWVYAAVASAESSMISSEPSIDLSELHSSFYSYYGEDQIEPVSQKYESILSEGGTIHMITNLWAQWIGPVREERFPYEEKAVFDDPAELQNRKYLYDYHMKNAYYFDFNDDRSNFEDVNATIKQFVGSGLAVDVSYMSDKSINFNNIYFTSNSKRRPRFANHAVAIIGWDDEFPAAKFKNSPEGDGAWLCKNSWGTTESDKGYFWLSYYDRTMCEFAVYEIENSDEHAYIYQHDTYLPIQNLSAYDTAEENGPSYMSNIFDSVGESMIDAVSTYINCPGTEYEITVYTDLKDENDPTSGTPSAVTKGRYDKTGYFSIDLDEPVHVDKSEKFSVVVRLYCEDDPFVIPLESSIYAQDDEGTIIDISSFSKDKNIRKFTARSQSFYSTDGQEWKDVCDGAIVYTDEEEKVLFEKLVDQLYDGLEDTDTELMKYAKESEAAYKDLFDNGTVKVTLGNISLKAYGNPVDKVFFSEPAGSISADKKVELRTDSGAEIYYTLTSGKTKSDPIKYTEPIAITDDVTVSAYCKGSEQSFERHYYPKKAEMIFIGYDISPSYYVGKLNYAKRTAADEFEIALSPTQDRLSLYIGTNCKVLMDGKETDTYTLTEPILTDVSGKEILFELSGEGVPDNQIKLRIVKNLVGFDLENETINYTVADMIYAPNGDELSLNSSVSEFAGEELTVLKQDKELKVKVPERRQFGELSINYKNEVIGPFDSEEAELLVFRTGNEKKEFRSAKGRFVHGEDVDGLENGSIYISVIPGETLTFKLRGGNDMFDSEELEQVIPEAPSIAPVIKYFEPVDASHCVIPANMGVEASATGKLNEMLYEALAEDYGYEKYEFDVILSNRFKADLEANCYVGSKFEKELPLEYGKLYLVRYPATDKSFASVATAFYPRAKGDVNLDGYVDAVDASMVLSYYAMVSTGKEGEFTDIQKAVADMDDNGIIDAVDASDILAVYAKLSVS